MVEGVLNTEGSTNIRLTRSFKLDDSAQLQMESGAQVTVESESGAAFPLYEQFGGTYSADQLSLDASEKYRLHIITNNGHEYASDYVPVLKNPPIDSVNWKRDQNGVTIYVNTHNPENDTRYYRWEFEETWENRSSYYAYYKLVNGKPVQRQLPEEQVYECWKHHNPSELILGSTEQLAQDVVTQKKLVSIPTGDDRLSVRYSILVRQFALPKEGYAFYQLLKKNTESLGSIFDAQPSEITGNIHALSDSTEKVIGFITIVPGQEQRIFITSDQVPDWGYYLYCPMPVKVPNIPDSFATYFLTGGYYPYASDLYPNPTVYLAVRSECAVCTLRGGTTDRPLFW